MPRTSNSLAVTSCSLFITVLLLLVVNVCRALSIRRVVYPGGISVFSFAYIRAKGGEFRRGRAGGHERESKMKLFQSTPNQDWLVFWIDWLGCKRVSRINRVYEPIERNGVRPSKDDRIAPLRPDSMSASYSGSPFPVPHI